ncbi:MAG: hypothetical protein HQK79_08575 [Desulfobacterales bacterium]|nr:hypothetical protein [Desulfobacterales bacterium]
MALEGIYKTFLDVVTRNELEGTNPYQMAPGTTGKSGWTFGQLQWDLSTTHEIYNNYNARDLFRNIITDSNLFNEIELDNIMKKIVIKNSDISEYENRINQALSSEQGVKKIQEALPKDIDHNLNRVNELIDLITETNDHASEEFLNQDSVKMFLMDYNNQFGLDRGGKMENFLLGNEVDFGGQNGTKKIHMGLEGNLDWNYLLKAVFSTEWGQKRPDDIARRFSNLIEGVGIYNMGFTAKNIDYLFSNILYKCNKFSTIMCNKGNKGLN